jgi:hypothetical protein
MNECWYKISEARSNYTKKMMKMFVLFDADDTSYEEKKKNKLVQYHKFQKIILSKEGVSKLTSNFWIFLP